MPNAVAGPTICDPQASESQQSEGLARQARGEVGLPVPGADRAVLDGDALGQGEDERPGDLDGRGDARAGVGGTGARHRDAALAQVGDVQRRVPHAGGDDEAEPRQLRQGGGGEGGALAHEHQHVIGRQPGGQLVRGDGL